jgi:hypothetical protein
VKKPNRQLVTQLATRMVFLVVVCVIGTTNLTGQPPQSCADAKGQNILAPGFQCALGGLTFSPFVSPPYEAPVPQPTIITSAFVRQDGAAELDLDPGTQCCSSVFALEVTGKVSRVTLSNLSTAFPLFLEICAPTPCTAEVTLLGRINTNGESGSVSFSPVSSVGLDAGEGFPSRRPFSLVFNQSACQVNITKVFHQWDVPPPPLATPIFQYPNPTVVNNNVAQYFGSLTPHSPPFAHPFVLCPTIRSGCGLTTAATMLSSFPALSSMTPIALDAALIQAGQEGYGTGCYNGANSCVPATDGLPDACEMNWPFIGWLSPTISMVDSQDTVGGTLVDNGVSTSVDDYLTNHVCSNGDRVILKLNELAITNGIQMQGGAHYIGIEGRSGNSDWTVFDPGWNSANIDYSTVANFDTLSGHERGFITNSNGSFVLRRFSVAGVRTYRDISSGISNTGAGPGDFSVVANSPVELLLVDPQGRRLGHAVDGDVFEIANGSYFRDEPLANDETTDVANGDPTAIKTLYVPSPQAGTYKLNVTGTGLGPYALRVGTRATDGSTNLVNFVGLTSDGSSADFEISMNTAPGGPSGIVPIISFATTIADIENSVKLDLIRKRISKRLSEMLENAQERVARGENEEARGILREFKEEVMNQHRKQIAELAAHVLLQDVNSLLGQIPDDDDHERSGGRRHR